MARPVFALRVRAEKGVPSAIRALRGWLKCGLREFGLRCLDIHQASTTEGDAMMLIDLRDTEAQRPEPIPKGVYCLEIEVKGGSAGREDCLRVAKNQRSLLLVLECTVIGGTYNGRKVWDYITVDLDESDRDDVPPIPSDKLEGLRTSVRMGRNRGRAVVDSANGLHPSDHSAATDAKRLLESSA